MKSVYKIISIIFQPVLVPTFGLLWLVSIPPYSFMPFRWKMLVIVGTLVFTTLLPALPIFILIKTGQVKDLFISDRKERLLPYLFSFVAYLIWAVFLRKVLHFPMSIAVFGIGSAVALLLVMFITLKWKISAHMCSMGGLVGFIAGISFLFARNPVLLLVIAIIISALVGLSRIELKAHTPSQVFAGFMIGFFCIFFSIFFFSLYPL